MLVKLMYISKGGLGWQIIGLFWSSVSPATTLHLKSQLLIVLLYQHVMLFVKIVQVMETCLCAYVPETI